MRESEIKKGKIREREEHEDEDNDAKSGGLCGAAVSDADDVGVMGGVQQ